MSQVLGAIIALVTVGGFVYAGLMYHQRWDARLKTIENSVTQLERSLFGLARLTVLAEEPAAGELAHGQRVFVDDGSCPSGQIKEVIGGSNIDPKTGSSIPGGTLRQRNCVPRK
jgi:hypothetical protein